MSEGEKRVAVAASMMVDWGMEKMIMMMISGIESVMSRYTKGYTKAVYLARTKDSVKAICGEGEFWDVWGR